MKALLIGIAAESRAIVARALGARDHEQIVAHDGVRALELFRQFWPALVIIEDSLVGMTAMEFCRQARASPAGGDAVILVIATADDAHSAILEAGATDLYATSRGPAGLERWVLIAERLVVHHARFRLGEFRFRRLFESGVAGVTISDVDGNFKEVNDAFLGMIGYTRAEMLEGTMCWARLSPSGTLPPESEVRAQLRSTGIVPLREREYVRKDGTRVATLVGSAALDGTGECISYVADISVRKREEEALRAAATQYRALFEHSPFAKFLYDADTFCFLDVNAAAIRKYGYSHEEFLGLKLDDLRPDEEPPRTVARVGESGPPTSRPGLRRHRRKDGTVIDVEVSVEEFVLGRRSCCIAVAVDVTKRNLLEAQLRHAQKMEAVGSLAGGVAHDFNNLLSVILSYSEMLAADLAEGDPMRADLKEILAAGRRGAEVTRQLLAFSRQQILEPRILDLNAIVGGIAQMVRRVVGEDVEVTVVSHPGLGTVSADRGQLEQVVMNLVVNARDAMPRGGKLTIATENRELGPVYAAEHPGVSCGSYVMLAVTDTGSGMDAATRERIFEPFFTTKEKGKGTGLGLSTAFGIVRQSGGHIAVETAPGAGTTFRVYLPQADSGLSVAIDAEPVEMRRRRGSETILLVEDEGPVRALARTILERHGYVVLEAQNAGDALLICEEYKGTIHVLLTDVIMPHMSGTRLADRLAPLRPAMKVLYMSGYTDDAVVRHGVLSEVALLRKPITPETLTRKIREMIESAPDGVATRASPLR
jgi:two-component system, cell cycle sensor histidine kinase and response regulator CckA